MAYRDWCLDLLSLKLVICSLEAETGAIEGLICVHRPVQGVSGIKSPLLPSGTFSLCPWPPPVRPEGHQGLTSSGKLPMEGKQPLGSDSYTRLFLLSSISPGYSADYRQPKTFPLGKTKQNEKLH